MCAPQSAACLYQRVLAKPAMSKEVLSGGSRLVSDSGVAVQLYL